MCNQNCLAYEICPDKGLRCNCKGFTAEDAIDQIVKMVARVMADRFTYHDNDSTSLDTKNNVYYPTYSQTVAEDTMKHLLENK